MRGRCHADAYQLAIRKVQQQGPPILPEGVRLLAWQPKQPPIAITAWRVVNDVPQFIIATLAQLEAALQGKNWLAGNCSVQELCERLEQVGVKLEVNQ